MAQELSEATRALVRSRIENYHSLTPEEQARRAIKEIAKDFYIYCERNLMIKDKRGQMVPLELNWAQKKLVEMVLEDLEAGRPVRYIILKARQMGLSTVIEALCFWWTTTHRNINSVIIAHKKKAAKNLYKMFRRYYDNANPYFQPDRKYNTKDDLSFDISDEEKKAFQHHLDVCISFDSCGMPHVMPGLGSEIQTMVAADGEGRSDTILFFHGSEVAHWDAGADVLSSALQAIPMLPNTFAFLESTANGVGGYFYDEWQFAKKGESAFKPVFFAWHEHPEYMIPGKIDVHDEEELELLEIFKDKGYPEEQWDWKLLWRREKKKEFRSDPPKFYQEYPKDDMEAFLASGRPVFDIRSLVKMETRAQQKDATPLFGQVVPNPDVVSKEKYVFEEIPVSFQESDPSPLKVWELPIKANHALHTEEAKYVIGVDVSEGKVMNASTGKENDWSVIDVTRVDTLKTVARWRGHIDPDLLGAVAYALGTFYNNALIGVEINNHGLTTAQSLRNKFYRNLYMRETSEDEQFQERTSKFGWLTNRKTKPPLVNNLVTAIREGDIIDLDIVFIRECMTYVRDDQGHTAAQEGMFDDTVMAKAIALKMADFNAIDANYAKQNIQKPIKRNTNATSSNTNRLDEIAAGKRRIHSNREIVERRRRARAAHKISRQRR